MVCSEKPFAYRLEPGSLLLALLLRLSLLEALAELAHAWIPFFDKPHELWGKG